MIPDKNTEVTKNVKKGNVTINPRTEDLMKEHLRSKLSSSLSELKEAAKKKDKEKKVKRWWDDDGDGIGYEKGEVKKEETEVAESNCGSDDSEAKEKSKERMKMKMIAATQEHDNQKKYGRK
jgi:hypothetical protein